MYRLCLKYLLITFLISVFKLTDSTSKDPFGEQPRISVENGHLLLRGAVNRNVSLLTTGDGNIWVNKDEFSATIQLVKSYLTENQAHTGNIESLSRRVQELQNQWSTIEQLGVQIDQLENNITSISARINRFIGPGLARSTSFRRYTRKLETLENQFREVSQTLSVNECTSYPCRNGGTCIDAYNSFNCICPSNWEGPTCETDVNECSLYYGTGLGCQHGATCYNSPGSYRCECAANWYGVHCTENHDDCTSASHEELCGHGTCVNENRVLPGQPKYRCICHEGWTTGGNGPSCSTDIDECSVSSVACSKNPPVACINLPGTFHCGPCPNGYTGSGQICYDIDECNSNNGGCSRMPYVTCSNTIGSRICGPCPSGYIGNGVQCTFAVGGCSANRGGCHPLATCVENAGAQPICICPSGYVGNGEGPTGCMSPQSQACSPNPCIHGTCQLSTNSFHCFCFPGFTGTVCDQAVDPCSSQPCENGGTCRSELDNSFSCICVQGFEGPTCTTPRQSCGGNLNSNSGTIQYPTNANEEYRHLDNCIWIIMVDNGKAVNLTIERLHIEPSSQCTYDFLQIVDGYTQNSPILGRYCGIHDNYQLSVISTHSFLYLWFRTDSSVAGYGFTLRWNATNPVCGGELDQAEYGAINSPGYPGSYPRLSDCYWLVHVRTGQRIRFQFATLQLEHHENCSFDSLKIYDGSSENDALLATYCTTIAPPPLTSSSSSVLLRFHSDSNIEDTGFHITYAAVPGIHGCGGILTTPTGSFTSPNYPDTYDRHLICEWLIRIHPNDRIRLTFTDFHLEEHQQCRFDFVEVYDGSSDADRIVGRYCGSSIPPELTSNGHQLFVKFRTDSSVQHNGFKANYKTICGGYFSELQGNFQSPYFPDFYPNHATCYYHIILPQGNIIQLQFPVLALEATSECRFDYVEVRDGGTEQSQLIGRYCSEAALEPITSTFNEIFIKFNTDGSVQNTGFYANYTNINLGCGGVVTADNGFVHTPMHPDYYPPSISCSWLIRAPPGFIVRLTFHTFVMEFHDLCDYDYVLVKDSSGANMGKYCGSTLPPILTSTDREMLVSFVSDYSNQNDGFNATYNFLDASRTCGGEYFMEAGVIRSPQFPQSYPHGRKCVWVLHAQNGHQLMLNVSSFVLESHPDCGFDYLEIRNGGYSSSPLFGKFCGMSIPRNITSFSNLLRLEFQSDGSKSAPGFEIYFDSATTGCGGTLLTPRGSIVSPNFPEPYGHNAECKWLIRLSEGSVIGVVFASLDIESHMDCSFDFIEIFDGNSESSRSLGRFCNDRHIPGVITSSSNTLLVKFRTDSSNSGGGFHLIYHSSCNSEITKRRGVIESPNFPNTYPHNHNCTWRIHAPSGSNISLAFSHLFLEGATSCDADYVEIREILEQGQENQLAKYCGTPFPLPSPIQTSSNIALVRLVTDSSITQEGFRLEYVFIGCGGEITKPNGEIKSPNYPNAYPHRTDCYWHFKYNEGEKVELEIKDLDIEFEQQCGFDFLRVYAGEDEQSPRLLESCHKQSSTPMKVTSHGNQMLVHFHSDRAVTGKGFLALFSRKYSGCGGIYTIEESTIMSPFYPNVYNANDECDWLIRIDPSRLIKLEFSEFSLPSSINCTQGYVAIYDGSNSSMPLLRRLCGDMPVDPVVSSTGSEMLIRLRADGNNVGRGFRAHYQAGCGRRIIADNSGELSSPGYPHFPLHVYNCSWIISATDPGEKVTVLITELRMSSQDECILENHSSLEIRDGDQPDSPLIDKFCGTTAPPPITSQGNSLHIFLHKYGIFRATYGITSSHCGGTLTADAGSFASPDYPNNYPASRECIWIVQASAGNMVQISFHTFSIESSDYCNMDYLEIHENDSGGRLIGRYCGDQMPSSISAAHKLWIKFQSDELGTGRGFTAEYNLVHGLQLNGTQGTIESPGYPNSIYHSSLGGYEWLVTVDESFSISIQFLEINIRPHAWQRDSCFSSVRLYDGFDDTAPLLGEFCGYNVPEPIVSFGNQVLIKFTTSATNGFAYGKWKLRWLAVDKRSAIIEPTDTERTCFQHVELNGTQPVNITSRNYPNTYDAGTNCEWIVRSAPYTHIRLHVYDLDLEGHRDACYDYVEIYTAPNPMVDSWVLNQTICERMQDSIFYAPNNILKIIFISDQFYSNRGFNIGVDAACGGTISGPSGVLKSSDVVPFVDTPGSDYYQVMCDWLITVGIRRTMEISFSQFNMPSDSVCSSMYLLLLNGGHSSSPMLGRGKYCGQSTPSVPETSSNVAFVRLHIGYIHQSFPSFELHYREISLSCGGHLYIDDTTPFVEIQSPNYPSPPSHPLECTWIIMSPSGTRMRFDMESDMHMTGDCWSEDTSNLEYIQLFDGGSETAEPLRRYCQNEASSSVFTTGNALVVTYLTQVEHPGSGFKGRIQTAVCGGMHSGWYGTLHSPNYPSNYTNALDCEYIIQTTVGFSLSIRINFLDTPSVSNCSWADYLEIRENDKDGELLARYCGSLNSTRVDLGGGRAYIRFKSDGSNTGKGFEILYQASEDAGCGARDINSEYGILTSPNYPRALSGRRDCLWIVRAPPGRAITVVFGNLDLPRDEDTRACLSLITISNVGFHFRQNTGSEFCGNEIPPPIQSASNTMYIRFRTLGLIAGAGFSLTFHTENEASCGGMLPLPSGIVMSPNHNSTEYSYLSCTWKVDVESDNRTTVFNFNEFDLPGNVATYCQESRVSFYGMSNMWLHAFCGNLNIRKPVFSSPFRETELRFYANMSIPYNGFRATYNVSDCGGVIRHPDAVITSPGYPGNYSSNLYCHWIILASPEERIQITFTDMRLESNCFSDYVLITDGSHPYSPILGKFCGTRLPQVIVSDSYAVTIIFRSSQYGSAPGFSLTLAEVEQGCGGVIHAKRGIITSPKYPNKYDNNVECVWDIEATLGYIINITFVDRFDLEMDSSCRNDYIKAEEFSFYNWELKLQACGSQRPESIVTRSRKMRLTFHSNEQIQGDGFKIQYTAVCGGVFTDNYGDIYSPNYPGRYDDNLHCQYLVGHPEHYVTVTFRPSFSVEQSMENCIYDHVTIYEGNTTSATVRGRYCGTTAPPSITLYGQILIEFVTDYSVTGDGFIANYKISDCGGILQRGFGLIQSPASVDGYFNHMDCLWQIQAPEDRVISLRINQLDLEAHSACVFDYLDIFDGNKTTGRHIARLCGDKPPPVLQSLSNQLTVHFVTDSSVTKKGFRGIYYRTFGVHQGCGGLIVAASGEISSLDFDNDGAYERNLDCAWKVIGTAGQVMKVTFSLLNIERENRSCSYDFVEVRDGIDMGDPLIGRYCGNTIPPPILTSDNKVLILFHSDGIFNLAGFRANFTSVPTVCGPFILNVTNVSKGLSSPHYPLDYPPNLHCRWRFVLDVGDVVLTFETLDVPCGGDYMEINAGNELDNRRYRLCGPKYPHEIVIKRNMWISFFTDSSGSGHGFLLNYKAAGCNRTYSAPYGFISDTGSHYRHADSNNCVVRILAPLGKTISLFFGEAYIMPCFEASFKIHDGENVTDPIISEHCGFDLPNPVFSSSNALTLEWHATDFNKYYISYTTTDKGRGCGGTLTHVNGTFSSPLYPLPYNQSSECQWEISVPGHHTLTLEFLLFSLNSTSGCDANYVELFEGHIDSEANRIIRLCGSDNVGTYTTQGSQMLVKLVTDETNVSPGFLAHFFTNKLSEREPSYVIHAPTSNEVEHLENSGTVYLLGSGS